MNKGKQEQTTVAENSAMVAEVLVTDLPSVFADLLGCFHCLCLSAKVGQRSTPHLHQWKAVLAEALHL